MVLLLEQNPRFETVLSPGLMRRDGEVSQNVIDFSNGQELIHPMSTKSYRMLCTSNAEDSFGRKHPEYKHWIRSTDQQRSSQKTQYFVPKIQEGVKSMRHETQRAANRNERSSSVQPDGAITDILTHT